MVTISSTPRLWQYGSEIGALRTVRHYGTSSLLCTVRLDSFFWALTLKTDVSSCRLNPGRHDGLHERAKRHLRPRKTQRPHLRPMVVAHGPRLRPSGRRNRSPASRLPGIRHRNRAGSGMGSQIPRYDKSKVTKIYGIEPTANLHGALRTKVRQCGLESVYEIVPCGIEDVAGLRKHGISLASADTVMSMQVLCSVPEPEEMVRRLYALLKPGGQMIVYEHVRSKDWVSRFVQSEFPLPLLLHIWSCLMSRVRMLTEARRCI